MRLKFVLSNHPDAASKQASNSFSLSLSSSAHITFHRNGWTSSSADLELLDLEEASMICGGNAAPTRKTSPPSTSRRSSRSALNTPSREATSKRSDGEWSPVLQNVLDQPPSQLPARLIVAGLLFSCVFGAWAWFGRIQEVSYAQGRLEPEGAVYKVQPVSAGEISQILVQEGDAVEPGQVIAVLDNRLAQAEIDRLNQSLAAYQLQYRQLQGLMEQTRQEMQTRQAIARANIQAQESAIAQVLAKADTAQQTIAHLQTENIAYQTRLARLQPLVNEGAIAQEHLFEVEQSVREYERMVTQSQGEIEQHLVEADRLRAGLTQKQAEGQQSELETRQRLQQLEREAADLQANMLETHTLLQAAQTKLEQLYLYAPVDGIISALNVQNVGEVIQPSQTIAEIAPDDAPLVLSAFLPNREAGLVDEGMQVQLKFDAFPYQEYGIVSGRVVSVSPDARMDEQLGAVYEVEIALEPAAAIDRGIQLKAGQTASAEIVTRQRRVMDLLLDPIKKLQGGVNL